MPRPSGLVHLDYYAAFELYNYSETLRLTFEVGLEKSLLKRELKDFLGWTEITASPLK